MKIHAILLFTCIGIFSCNSNHSPDHQTGENKDKQPSGDSTTVKPRLPDSGCYMRVLQRDSLVARLQFEGDRVTGDLRFDNFEKDGSSGPVSGLIKENIIKLIYTFESEGTTSVMEVYFKTDGANLIRGIGEMGSRNDTVSFKNPDAVKYPVDEKWGKVDCNL